MKAKLIAGIMYSGGEDYSKAVRELEEKFGEVEAESEVYDFNFTDYYAREMGADLKKRFVAFKEEVEQGRLADIKIFTMEVEGELSQKGRRRVNIDPGYITRDNLVLASTKKRGHRIYLGRGIYSEVALVFGRQRCIYMPWTYADYKTKLACDFFLRVRGSLNKLG